MGYEEDLKKAILINGKQCSLGYYNLIVSIRDVSLFAEGMRIHKNFRISDVKAYFNVKGSTKKVLEQLQELKNNLA